jgi:hypothetical protein
VNLTYYYSISFSTKSIKLRGVTGTDILEIGIFSFLEGNEETLLDRKKETAILLLEGSVRWNGTGIHRK